MSSGVFVTSRKLWGRQEDDCKSLFLSREKERERERNESALFLLFLSFFLNIHIIRARERENQTTPHGAEFEREFFHRVVVV